MDFTSGCWRQFLGREPQTPHLRSATSDQRRRQVATPVLTLWKEVVISTPIRAECPVEHRADPSPREVTDQGLALSDCLKGNGEQNRSEATLPHV